MQLFCKYIASLSCAPSASRPYITEKNAFPTDDSSPFSQCPSPLATASNNFRGADLLYLNLRHGLYNKRSVLVICLENNSILSVDDF